MVLSYLNKCTIMFLTGIHTIIKYYLNEESFHGQEDSNPNRIQPV